MSRASETRRVNALDRLSKFNKELEQQISSINAMAPAADGGYMIISRVLPLENNETIFLDSSEFKVVRESLCDLWRKQIQINKMKAERIG